MKVNPLNRHDTAVQIATAAPSVLAVVWIKILGLSINDWLGLFGIFFLVLQAGYLLWKWRRDIKRERRGQPPLDTDRGHL